MAFEKIEFIFHLKKNKSSSISIFVKMVCLPFVEKNEDVFQLWKN